MATTDMEDERRPGPDEGEPEASRPDDEADEPRDCTCEGGLVRL